jgi:uncharacterized membrane protein YgdD (TMEM256/DUF423 family)
MSDSPEQTPAEAAKRRRWFVILSIVVLVGFAIFVGAITVLSMKIPELKKPKYGVLQIGIGDRPA